MPLPCFIIFQWHLSYIKTLQCACFNFVTVSLPALDYNLQVGKALCLLCNSALSGVCGTQWALSERLLMSQSGWPAALLLWATFCFPPSLCLVKVSCSFFFFFLSSSSFSSPPSCPPPCIVYAWVRHVCALMCACVWRPEEGGYQCSCCCSPYFLETKSSHRARARLTGPNMQVNLLTPPMCSNPQCRVTGVCVTMPRFYMVLGIQIHVVMLSEQVPWLSQLSPQPNASL